jgi:hypothetical protein
LPLNRLRRSQIRKMGDITHATIKGMCFAFGFCFFPAARLRCNDPSMIYPAMRD